MRPEEISTAGKPSVPANPRAVSNTDVPGPAVLERPYLAQVIELVFNDNAVEEFDALVA